MKYFDWSEEKNDQLKAERGISFEDIIVALTDDRVLDVLPHINAKKCPNQKIYVVEINQYVYLVPFVEDDEKVFLKTIFPSRKATKHYLIDQ
mgnify:CR=1 FL=1